jgi:hypothetical protein
MSYGPKNATRREARTATFPNVRRASPPVLLLLYPRLEGLQSPAAVVGSAIWPPNANGIQLSGVQSHCNDGAKGLAPSRDPACNGAWPAFPKNAARREIRIVRSEGRPSR